jgi:TonB family protein
MALPRPLRVLAAIVAIVTSSGVGRAHAAPPQELRSLHLRFNVEYGDAFVFVEQQGRDVRLRAVEVVFPNEYCPKLVVRAAEKIVTNTTVQKLAGTPVCSMTNARVDAALKKARDRHGGYIDFQGSIDAVVAECGGETREFVLEMPPVVDQDRLRRGSPDVGALFDLARRLRSVILASEAYDEALGTALVPYLLSGKYSALLTPKLSSYTGPPAVREPRWSEIVERASLDLVEYVQPVMPPIAISARVAGDVRVRLTVDAGTGAVTSAEALSGPPLLAPAALDAIRRWRFSPGAAPAGPLEVTARFSVRCPD